MVRGVVGAGISSTRLAGGSRNLQYGIAAACKRGAKTLFISARCNRPSTRGGRICKGLFCRVTLVSRCGRSLHHIRLIIYRAVDCLTACRSPTVGAYAVGIEHIHGRGPVHGAVGERTLGREYPGIVELIVRPAVCASMVRGYQIPKIRISATGRPAVGRIIKGVVRGLWRSPDHYVAAASAARKEILEYVAIEHVDGGKFRVHLDPVAVRLAIGQSVDGIHQIVVEGMIVIENGSLRHVREHVVLDNVRPEENATVTLLVGYPCR